MKTGILKVWKSDEDRELMQEAIGDRYQIIAAYVDRNELVQLGHSIADALGMEMRVAKNERTHNETH